jgi:hypothetical protein
LIPGSESGPQSLVRLGREQQLSSHPTLENAMPTMSPRTIEFTYLVAPAIRIETLAVGDPVSHNADDTSAKIMKIMREVMDKILQQSYRSIPSKIVLIDDLVLDNNGNLSFDPAYKIVQPLKKYAVGNTPVSEIYVAYHVADCTFNISAWNTANPLVRYSNADTGDPQLMKEMFARIVADYKAPGSLTITTRNGNIRLTT